MRYGHFYTVDQWELRDAGWISNPWQKQMYHTPCNHPVCKARTGIRWVCIGCYTEPPEEIMDVIYLGDIYKGWNDNYFSGLGSMSFYQPYTLHSPFYTRPNASSTTNFYMGYLTSPRDFFLCNDSSFKVSGLGSFAAKDPDDG